METSQKPVWTTCVTTPDTSPSLLALLRPVSEQWRSKLKSFDFESGLDSLTVVVHLGNPPVPEFRERRSYHGELNVLFSSVAIEYPAWRDARSDGRFRLLETALSRAIDNAPKRRVSAAEKDTLVTALRASISDLQADG